MWLFPSRQRVAALTMNDDRSQDHEVHHRCNYILESLSVVPKMLDSDLNVEERRYTDASKIPCERTLSVTLKRWSQSRHGNDPRRASQHDDADSQND